jgi:hypothetical protein
MTSPRARWIALVAGALGVGAVAVIVLLGTRRDPEPVSAPQPAPPPEQPRPEPPEQPRPDPPEQALRTEPTPPPTPAQPSAPTPEPYLSADGALAVPLVVPMHASTIPDVRIPAGTRGVLLLLDVPIPSSLDGLTVWVRGPQGRVPARLDRTGGSHGLAIELDAALQAGVHEILVTNDDETTLAHHRLRAVPAGAAPDSSRSP